MTFLIALLDGILITLSFIWGVACASVFLEIPFTKPEILRIFEWKLYSECHEPLWFVASMFFLFLSFFSVYFRRRRSTSEWTGDVTFVTPKGNVVQITNEAMTEYIEKLVHSIDGVHSSSVEIKPLTKKKMSVKIYLSLQDGSSYPEVNDKLQDTIREKLKTDLGVTHISSITVVLDKIIHSKTTHVPVEDEVVVEA